MNSFRLWILVFVEVKVEKGYQYKDCRRESLEINCVRVDYGFCNKEIKFCISLDGSVLEDRIWFFLSFRKSWGN